MRRLILLLMSMVLLIVGAVPASATTTDLEGPAPAIWLSDPDGDDGTNGTEQGSAIEGASGSARLNSNGATIKVKATGLEPGHAYTMWVVFFSDQNTCADNGSGNVGCNGDDLPDSANGVTYGAGAVVGGSGNATFVARLNDGSAASGFPGVYEAGADNEFHVVIRSHGPKIPGEVSDQIHSQFGGCDAPDVGPAPEEEGDFPVPTLPGECGDVQLYVFS